ncbi:MAG TPA: hypothetical protein VES66_02705 [Terriglobales bacterium]|nr:hypothetical protein [Terriglobales bacterium]
MNRLHGKTVVGVLFFTLFAVCARAQQQPCKGAVVPATITFRDGKPVPGIDAKSLKAKIGRKSAEVMAAGPDNNPRRVVLVVDTGKEMNKDGWKVAMAMSNAIVNNARAVDSFALLTYAGAKEAIPFGATNDAVREKLAALDATRPPIEGKGQEMGLYDGVSEALAMLGQPQFGDAILLFAANPEEKGHADIRKLEQTLLARATRLIALSLTQRPLPAVRDTVLTYTPKDEIATGFTTDQLRSLALETGGLFYLENTQPTDSEYKLTDAHLKDLMKQGMQMYIVAVRVYRIEVGAPATAKLENLELEPKDELRKQASQILILHPSQIAACGLTVP